MKVKEKLHSLIDQIEDDSKLESYLSLITLYSSNEEGRLMSKLTKDQRNSLDKSYQESLDPTNLLTHDQVKAKYAKWL